jgi:hypothetical protein
MRITAVLLGVLCGAALHAQDAQSIKAGPHHILFASGAEEQAQRAARVLTAITDAATRKYGTRFDGFRAEVRLRLPPAEMRSRSGPYACCIRDMSEGVTIATVAYDAALTGHDDDVSLATAFMPLTYLAVQTERGPGWLFNDAPEWFIEGLPMLDGRYGLSPSPQVARAGLVRWKQQHQRDTECCGGNGRTLFLPDQAMGGAAFLAYLAERFGEDVHARIVRSSAPSFTRAFTEETRPYTLPELFTGFSAWE